MLRLKRILEKNDCSCIIVRDKKNNEIVEFVNVDPSEEIENWTPFFKIFKSNDKVFGDFNGTRTITSARTKTTYQIYSYHLTDTKDRFNYYIVFFIDDKNTVERIKFHCELIEEICEYIHVYIEGMSIVKFKTIFRAKMAVIIGSLVFFIEHSPYLIDSALVILGIRQERIANKVRPIPELSVKAIDKKLKTILNILREKDQQVLGVGFYQIEDIELDQKFLSHVEDTEKFDGNDLYFKGFELSNEQYQSLMQLKCFSVLGMAKEFTYSDDDQALIESAINHKLVLCPTLKLKQDPSRDLITFEVANVIAVAVPIDYNKDELLFAKVNAIVPTIDLINEQ